MIIHTLGGTQTDSYAAAQYYLQHHDPQGSIVLHPSFEDIYGQLATKQGDYLLVPAAFRSRTGASWGDLHYRYLDHLDLTASFITKLAPMVVAKRPGGRAVAYSHAATASLLQTFIPHDVHIKLAPSKWAAYQEFQRDGRYVLTSKKLLDPADHDVQVVRELAAKMLWSLYRIH